MSYDIRLVADVGLGDGPERYADLADASWNYTANVSPMWRRAMPETDGLIGLDFVRAAGAAAEIGAGIDRMLADPDSYRAMNPANGWGDFDRQLDLLQSIYRACRRYPRAVLRVSR